MSTIKHIAQRAVLFLGSMAALGFIIGDNAKRW
jgi:hypothetical protein